MNKLPTIVQIFLVSLLVFAAGAWFAHSKYYDNLVVFVKSGLKYVDEFEYSKRFDGDLSVWIDDKQRAHDGLLLISAQFTHNPAVVLVNRDGDILHRWNLEKRIFNPEIEQRFEVDFDQERATHAASDIHLYPNGGLLVSQDIRNFNGFRGMRLARLDKDSNVLWEAIGALHHELYVRASGEIYALDYELRDTFPFIDASNNALVKYLADTVKVFSPDGDLRREIAIIDAFVGSDYEYLVPMFRLNLPSQKLDLKNGVTAIDTLHANSVQYIEADIARQSAIAEEGDLLISMRGNSAIAVLRPSINKIVWATRGPWRHQHYVRMNEKGRIIIYDNDGGRSIHADEQGNVSASRETRLIEFDPVSRDVQVLFHRSGGMHEHSYWRGYYAFPDEDSMLMSFSDKSRVMQVDRDGNTIWELRAVRSREVKSVPYTKQITGIRYYAKDYAAFLQ